MVQFRTLFLYFYFFTRCISELIYPVNNSNLYYPLQPQEWSPYLETCPNEKQPQIESGNNFFSFFILNILLILIATALAAITHFGIKIFKAKTITQYQTDTYSGQTQKYLLQLFQTVKYKLMEKGQYPYCLNNTNDHEKVIKQLEQLENQIFDD